MLLERKELMQPEEEEQIEPVTMKKKTWCNQNAIKTFCRLRPNNASSAASINYSITSNEGMLVISEDQVKSDMQRPVANNANGNGNGNGSTGNVNSISKQGIVTKFNFTKVFDANYTQMSIYTEVCSPMIDDLLSFKRSGLIFAYGLSNSGKTHTIIGTMVTPGILPLSLIAILEQVKERQMTKDEQITIECSYVEIYNEEIFDLLSPNKTKVHLKEKDKIFYLTDSIVKDITSIEDFTSALNDGIMRKIHSSTKLNPQSSRSHTIFKIIAKGKGDQSASLSIVDLAGAERSVRTETKGKELYQAGKINQSLMILGRCIDAMEWNTRYIHGDKKIPVPIRESKLTKIFQEYFTGEHNVSMIATINLNKDDLAENKNVLSYACKAKRIQPIKSWVTVVKKPNAKARNINKENEGVTMLLTGYNSDSSIDVLEHNNNNKRLLNATADDNEHYDRLKDQYTSLVDRYENTIDEAEYYKDKNDALVKKLTNIEHEYSAREYNAILTNERQFFMNTWENMCNNDKYPTMKMKKINFTFPNPLYKKEEEVKSFSFETCNNNNLEIIQLRKKQKTFKEIAESFTIVSIGNKSLVNNKVVKDDSEVNKKKKEKKKKNNKRKGYKTSTSTIEEEEDDEDNERSIKKKRRNRKKNECNYNSDSDRDRDKDNESNASESGQKYYHKKTKMKNTKRKSMSSINTERDDDSYDEEEIVPDKKKKTKAKKTKSKAKRYQNDDEDDPNEDDEDDDKKTKKPKKTKNKKEKEITELKKGLDKETKTKRKNTKSKNISVMSIDHESSQDSNEENNSSIDQSSDISKSDSEEEKTKRKKQTKKAKNTKSKAKKSKR